MCRNVLLLEIDNVYVYYMYMNYFFLYVYLCEYVDLLNFFNNL